MTSTDASTASDLRLAAQECSDRGLVSASNWAAELLLGIPASKRKALANKSTDDSTFSTSTPAKKRSPPILSFGDDAMDSSQFIGHATPQLDRHLQPLVRIDPEEQDALAMARACFEAKEFLRIKSVLSSYSSPKARFLSLYSQFLVGVIIFPENRS